MWPKNDKVKRLKPYDPLAVIFRIEHKIKPKMYLDKDKEIPTQYIYLKVKKG